MEPNTELYLEGRHVTRDDIHVIRDLLNAHPDWSRSYLSKELCQYWNWRNEIGALKDIACRSLLRRLEQLEQIRLPQGLHKNDSAERRRAEIEQPVFHSREAIECPLKRFYPIEIQLIEKGIDLKLFKYLIATCHYLGWGKNQGTGDQKPSILYSAIKVF